MLKTEAQFKNILYSQTEDSFNEENAKFLDASQSIQVRINDEYKSLSAYYSKNWESCKDMWAKCFRKHLPTLGDDTTNRTERNFWSIKQYLIDTFRQLPDTATSIMHVIKLAEGRLTERYDYASVKSLRIFDSNEAIQRMNDTASKHLNDRGCTIFHIAQKSLEKNRSKMSVALNGIKHDFDESSYKVYDTTSLSCTCSFFSTHQAPCSHILFFREQNEENFTVELFHSRYLKAVDLSSVLVFPCNQEVEEYPNDELTDNRQDELSGSLDQREKHNIVTPVLLRIGSLISAHSTNQFLEYVDELEALEKRVRKGQTLLHQSTCHESHRDDLSSPVTIAAEITDEPDLISPVPPSVSYMIL